MKFRLLARVVFERLPVEGQALIFFSFSSFHLFVEAAFGFVAEPLFLQHLLEEIWQAQIAALVVNVGSHVADDVAEDVEADKIDGAEGRGLRPADSLPGERVNFFDAQIHFLHEANHVQYRKCSDAVADEVGRVFGDDDAFAELDVAEVRDRVDGGAVGFRSGNDFQQPHVARRIEEVRAEPGATEIVGKSFGDFADGQAAGVGGDDGAGLADGFDFLQQACA